MVLTLAVLCALPAAARTQEGQPPVAGAVVATSSLGAACCGVTDRGEIFVTRDGVNWSVTDFNELYSGYYGRIEFTCACLTETSMIVAGVNEDGLPAAYTSSRGTVWSERPLTYTVRGETYRLEAKPLSAEYQKDVDRFVLVCVDGIRFNLPNCSHCNTIEFTNKND